MTSQHVQRLLYFQPVQIPLTSIYFNSFYLCFMRYDFFKTNLNNSYDTQTYRAGMNPITFMNWEFITLKEKHLLFTQEHIIYS